MRLVTPKWNETPTWWPKIEKWVEQAIMYGGGATLYPRDVQDGLTSRSMKLWLAFEGEELKACCVTHQVNYPRMRLLHIIVVGAEEHTMDNWLLFYDAIESFAKTLDLDGVEYGGRGGWQRTMSKFGFEPVYTLQRKMF